MRFLNRRLMAVLTRTVLAGCLVVLAAACAGVPGTRPTYRVVSTEPIGPLLDVRLEWAWPSRAAVLSSDAHLSLLFRAADGCTEMLTAAGITNGFAFLLELYFQTTSAIAISVVQA